MKLWNFFETSVIADIETAITAIDTFQKKSASLNKLLVSEERQKHISLEGCHNPGLWAGPKQTLPMITQLRPSLWV